MTDLQNLDVAQSTVDGAAGLAIHPAAELFPMMQQSDFQEMLQDIEKNGVQESIVLYQGKLLDGRNRLKAMNILGIDYTYHCVEIDDHPDFDPVDYVVSHNLHRRHLEKSQRAMIAAGIRKFYDDEARERQKRKPSSSVPENLPEQKADARDLAGKAVGVSGRTIDFATKVLEKGTPDLVKAVEQGRVAVSTAAMVAHESPEVQKSFLEDPKRNRVYKPGNGKPKESGTEGRSDIKRVVSDALALSRMAIMQLERIQKDDPCALDGFDMVEDWIEKERAKRQRLNTERKKSK